MEVPLKRIGIFAGTFDPLHNGHIEFAKAAAKKYQLDKVFLAPERNPRNKTNVAPYQDRLNMLKLVLESSKNLEILEVPEAYFTVASSWPRLKKTFGEAEIFLLLGSDSARQLPKWQNLSKLKNEAQFIIGLRNEDRAEELNHVNGLKIHFLKSPKAGITASQVRNNKDDSLTDPKVISYIRQHKLYN